jgi:hypothetical protein
MSQLRRDPEFLRYYAQVLIREAGCRAGTEFATFLRAGAERALSEAAAWQPEQGDLFNQRQAA